MKSVKAVLFDIDGVLVESDEAIVRSFQHTFSHLHLEPPKRDKIMLAHFHGKTSAQWIRAMLPPKLRKDEELVKKMSEHAEGIYAQWYFPMLARAMEGANETLDKLRRKKIKLAIITNNQRATTEKILSLFGFGEFDCILSAEDTVEVKPSPEPLLLALKKLRVKKNEAIFVGDTDIDVVAGERAGIKTVVVAHERNAGLKGWKRISSLKELLALV
jgi:pyrophosphatase PpaX